ncbi:hypothetical protein CcaverHIS631_0406590 [Cutaneotrichosporon cavernicola]|nr:hypothetical protein CcaverHIS631_0406590 [Cutaneotrichosporon cavernicola]BEJ07392.1 hypothetical protein CcaverHIS641_0406610 [Cutaneotrichosporon cavernicola]
MSPSHAGSSPRPLSARYTRGSTTRGSPRPTAPKPSRELILPDLFTESGNTPTQGAMWCNRLARRMADRERKKQRREDALTRFRGMTDHEEPEDEDERERQAQADDEEIFRRLMVLQRRREQHAALVSHETETGGSDPALPDIWEEEVDALAREERALYQHLNASFADDDEWAREAAAAEEAEASAEAAELAWAEQAERQARGPDEFDEADWAAIAALQDEAEPMDIE